MSRLFRGGTRFAFLPILLAGSACARDPDPPGAVTADEARQLNEAAEMLDANSIDLNATIEEDAR